MQTQTIGLGRSWTSLVRPLLAVIAILSGCASALAGWVMAPPSSAVLNASYGMTFQYTPTATGTASFWVLQPNSGVWTQTSIGGGGNGPIGGTINGGGQWYATQLGTWTIKVVDGTSSSGTIMAGPTTVVVSQGTPPSITNQPQNATVAVGGSATFSVTAAGSAPLTYYWYKNNASISGAYSSQYTLTNIQASDAGQYKVSVSNPAGQVYSNTVTLTVNAAPTAPTITTHPASQTVAAGQSVTFSVSASGTAPLSYQWRKDGASLSGQTNATYSITNVNAGQAGVYSVVVSNGGGSATSNGASLTVTGPPVITQHPYSQDLATGQLWSLSVEAAGATPISYQWRKDGVTIPNQTSSYLNVGTVQASDAGVYTVIVSNTYGSVTSNAATITVSTPPGGSGGNSGTDPGTPSTPVGTLVGTLPGSLSVDNRGSANYSIPLATPPGRSGLQPSLSLNYSSSGGNGPLGVGFSLSTGFPQSITRGRSILARDGVVQGVTFTASDKFYLDGKRLILVSTDKSYGEPGSVYRTEVDSFVTITTTGTGTTSANWNIDTFTVTDKSGTKMTFGKWGTSLDGYAQGGGEATGRAYSYLLKNVQDAVGNTVDFLYSNPAPGEYNLAEIDYTGGLATANNAVIFTYDTTRPDQPRTFIAGRSFEHTSRLKTITVKSEGKTVITAAYTLGYSNTDSFGTATGNSRLVTISPILADPNSTTEETHSVPATTIHWPTNVRAMAPQTTAFPLPSLASLGVPSGIAVPLEEITVYGDFNGDGKQDYAYWDPPMGIWVQLSTGTGWGQPALWLTTSNLRVRFPKLKNTVWNPNVAEFPTYLLMHAGDVNGDGTTDLILTDSAFATLCAVKPNGTQFVGLNNETAPTAIADISSQFGDPPGRGTSGQLLAAEGTGASSRIGVADFTGDGRDDIAIMAYDGFVYFYESAGTSFSAHGKSSIDTGTGGIAYLDSITSMGLVVSCQLICIPGPTIRVMPADVNGDGRMDYVFVQISRTVTPPSESLVGRTGYRADRKLRVMLSKTDGTFSDPVVLPWALVPYPLGMTGTYHDIFSRDEVALGILSGDFNGDGMTDYLTQTYVPYRGIMWSVNISTGQASTGNYTYQSYGLAVPNKVTVTTGSVSDSVTTYCNVIKNSAWTNQLDCGFNLYNNRKPDAVLQAFSAVESGNCFNTFAIDVNGDGLSDLVWYVDTTDTETTLASANNKGWWAMLSTGKFTAGSWDSSGTATFGSGFTAPVKIPTSLISQIPGAMLTSTGGGPTGFSSVNCTLGEDFDGDGHADLLQKVGTNGITTGLGTLALARASDLTSPAPFDNLVDQVTNGLGSVTSVAYKAAKDDSLYTPGASVSYPIREVRGSNPVVSDVWQDTGGTATAQFSYQYSGNRTDLSGRGSLGFHSFVTLDRQTGLFKYQFLAQSFPMTGLTHREETYRNTAPNTFNIISSHDNTVVFDTVVKSPTDATPWGTLWPFISKATEYRWEDDGRNNKKTFTVAAIGSSARPEELFGVSDRGSAHVVVTATSVFDNQSAPLLSVPGGYYASDYNPANGPATRNVVKGAGTQTDFTALLNAFTGSSYGKITHGNLKELRTEFGATDGAGIFTAERGEKVITNYYAQAANGVAGLVQDTRTETWGGGYGTEVAPEKSPKKSYTYWSSASGQTALPLTETVDASSATYSGGDSRGSELNLTTTYTRDARGRVTQTQIASPDPDIGSYVVSSVPTPASDFDDTFDLPKKLQDNYGHVTTTSYHAFLGLPTSVTDANGVVVATQYDALGRTFSVTRTVDGKAMNTTTTYAFDSSTAVAPPATGPGASLFKGYAPLARTSPTDNTAIVGVSVPSVFKTTTTQTAKPTVKTYFDRLGRAIRTEKTGFNNQLTLTDTAYNNLGQVVATTVPYLSTAAPQWNTSAYDELGRVELVTAANGTKSTSAYAGRTTSVKVDAVAIDGGVDPAAQTTSTEVDAKGRTIKVWNPDPSTGLASSTASLEFKLDGFGRMRTTIPEGVTNSAKQIHAKYDALGRQVELADPDKGTWTYKNNALGQVVSQTDAMSTLTDSTFDKLGRPLTRTTTQSSGQKETAKWFYFESAGYAGINDSAKQLVAKGTKGWIGALQRDEVSTTGAPGYGAANSSVRNVHYYTTRGLPELDLAEIDGKWFYTATTYDDYDRPTQVRHYWKPAGAELPNQQPYVWQDFGYVYGYDDKSYLLSITDSLGRLWWQVATTGGYDHLDRPVKVQKGNAYWTQRAYRPADGVLQSIKTGQLNGVVVGTELQNMVFDFDGLGNLTSRSDTGVSENFAYDAVNRLWKRNGVDIASYQVNGNISSKTEVGGGLVTINAYDGAHPHAVSQYTFGTQTFNITYDGNGNMLTRTDGTTTWSLKWTGFDRPRWMAKGNVGSEFLYNANRSRVLQLEFDTMSGGAPEHYTRKRTYALGSTLELNYNNTVTSGNGQNWNLDTVRIYVPGPDGIIGAREFRPASGGSEKALVYHYDHLGSITAITDWGSTSGYSVASGNKSGRYSEDPWGQRRDPLDWTGAPTTATDDGGPDSLTPRGFTGHEMLDDLGLVHMNGRIYDPLLGRFLSADLDVPAPSDLQSFNRYSYVRNNPLSAIDPSGFLDVNLTSTADTGTITPTGHAPITYSTHDAFGAYPTQSGRTSFAVHGQPNGGFSSDRAGNQSIPTDDINTAITGAGHQQGDEIVALVCYGGVGSNLTELSVIARLQNSPIAVATDQVQIGTRLDGNGAVTGYRGTSVLNGGRWLVIEPNGTVRDRGTPQNAAAAEQRTLTLQTRANASAATASQSQANAQQAAARATQASAAAVQARATANGAKGTATEKADAKRAADAEKAAKRAQKDASKAQKQADRDQSRAAKDAAKAAEEAERARKLRREADNPI